MEPSSERVRLVESATADIELEHQTNMATRPPAAPRWFYVSTTAVAGVLGLLLLATQPSPCDSPAEGDGRDTQPTKATQLPPPPPPVVPDSALRAGESLPSSGSYAGRSSSSPRVLRRAVLVLADYMATSDIEPFAPSTSEITTPRLRRMAAEGVIFTSFYSASPICGPSRASLLSGLYPRHVGLEVNLVEGDPGLPPSVPTLPRRFSDAGWSTSLSGKWHLGYNNSDSPNAHGFSNFFGFLDWNIAYYSHGPLAGSSAGASHDTSKDMLVRNGEPAPTEGYTTDLFTNHAIDFINSHAESAFFVEVAYNAALPPYTPPVADGVAAGLRLESSRRGIGTRTDYVAMIERVDWGVGHLLDALRDHPRIQGNCLTIFTCDHGGAEMSTVGESGVHLQQGFATLWEGGLRIPVVMHWPGVLQPPPSGGVVSTPAIMMDLTVTLLELAGLDNSQLDGVSLLPQIDRAIYGTNASTTKPYLPGTGGGGPMVGATGVEDSETQDRVFYWRLNLPPSAAWASGQRRAVRRGRWKYLWDGGFGYLFDLIDDPAETVNVYSRHETLARELEALSLTDW